ncbi:MAG: monofunctional biosynthetic peptidoglycan transglycosylase [Prevotellaceae bacterium]|nr:monofunctional biosynthetic peptidoglycan transglycosylase [Prevotellaceae bacterium]MDD6843311.1 monofunctional biosynthetic peptidoglycan transglycosylase [Prevotellaceae bacterium]
MIIISKLKTIVKWMVVAFFGSTILAVVTLRFMPVYFTPLMFIRVGQQITSGESIKLKHHWVSIDEMSKDMPLAVMSSEDQRFLMHHGFDFDAIQQAAKENREGKRKRGASTISQQTAKNVFLWPGRTWLRKGLETYFTFLIEALWSKQRIMEVYLNSIEMGNGIYGAEAVAQEHFGCKASQLTRKQCALIAATLPNPRKFNSAAPSPYMKKRQRRIVKEMNYMEKNMDADISKHDY